MASLSENPFESITKHFDEIEDPRVQGRCDHKLSDIIAVAVVGVLCGANSWSEIETVGKAKEEWLRPYLELPNGIPSHDTFGRVFGMLDAEVFEAGFANWVEASFKRSAGQVVAVDGKKARGSQQRGIGIEAIHLIRAWASEDRLVLGQQRVAEGTNEISTIPDLLKSLNLTESVVTIDAIGCQKEIAQTILDRKADYVLAVKANQANFRQDLEDWFVHAQQVHFEGMTHDFHQATNKTSGRVEIRRCWAIADPLAFEYIRHHQGWPGLQTIVMIERERRYADKVQHEVAYFISSLPPDAAHLLQCVRHHWSIENTCHWTLDVIFNEDASRVRIGHGPQNFAIIRHFALNLLKHDPSKGSLNQKRLRAALDDSFRSQLLSHILMR
jgi:predicted transposase YbfD/YdcC